MKKIAVNTVKKFLKAHGEEVVTLSFPVEDNTFEVKVRTRLTAEEKTTFIHRVLSGCFDAGGDYRPEYKQAAMHATILQICTDVPVISLKREEGDESTYMDFDAMSNLYLAMEEQILGHEACRAMIQEMYDVCAEAIAWKRDKLIADRNDAMADAINAFGAAANSVRLLADVLKKKADETDPQALTEYAGKLATATKGLDGDNVVAKVIELSAARDEKK